MKTTVVNIHNGEYYDELCTRPSMFSNPFRIGPDGTREQVLIKYVVYLVDHPEIVEQARRLLTGKRLGCVCKPLRCHLDILIKFMERK